MSLDINQRYLVIVADRKVIRIFTMFLGNIEEEGLFMIDENVPQRSKAHWGNTVDHHILEHLKIHLKLISKKVVEFSKGKKISGVVIGGHKELNHKIAEFLPNRFKHIIRGYFIADTDESLGVLTEKAKLVS